MAFSNNDRKEGNKFLQSEGFKLNSTQTSMTDGKGHSYTLSANGGHVKDELGNKYTSVSDLKKHQRGY